MSTPLHNRRIVITRAREDNPVLARLLRERGAVPIDMPSIEIVPLPEPAALPPVLQDLDSGGWLVFTSAKGVELFFRWAVLKPALPLPCRIASVGTSTESVLQQAGCKVSFIPSSFTARNLATQLPDVEGRQIVWIGPQGQDPEPQSILENRSARVHYIAAYATRPCPLSSQALRELRNGVDAIAFASPSAVDGFMTGQSAELSEWLSRIPVACIGPVTSAAARRWGLHVVAVPATHDLPGMVDALETYFARRSEEVVK